MQVKSVELGAFQLRVERKDTVLSLKELIQRDKNIPVENQILIVRSSIAELIGASDRNVDEPCVGRVLENNDVILPDVILCRDPNDYDITGLKYFKFYANAEFLSVQTDAIATSKQPLNRSRLFFVGEGRAGKTSMSNALRGLPFKEDEESTKGINEATCDIFETVVFELDDSTCNWESDKRSTYKETTKVVSRFAQNLRHGRLH